jgi:hypothetical protein
MHAAPARWGIASLIIFDATIAASPASQKPYTFYRPIAQAIALSIIIGVWGLSAMKCTLLADAANEFGPAGYIAGNFAIHYYPALRIFAAKDTNHHPQKPSPNQAATALAIFLAFLSYNNAAHVYGCSVAENVIVFASAGGITLAFLAESHENDYAEAAIASLSRTSPRKKQKLSHSQPGNRQAYYKPD